MCFTVVNDKQTIINFDCCSVASKNVFITYAGIVYLKMALLLAYKVYKVEHNVWTNKTWSNKFNYCYSSINISNENVQIIYKINILV